MFSKSIPTWCVVIVAFVYSGCLPALKDGKPRAAQHALPAAFPEQNSDMENSTKTTWKEIFQDPHLVTLIGQALANNQELNILIQEIVVANSEIMARRGEYLPKVGIGAGAGLDKVGDFTSRGVSDRAHDVPGRLQDYKLGLYATWELDIWGKLRKATKSAMYRYLASIEGRHFVITQLVAEIARTYYDLLALDRQIEVLQQNIALQQDALEAVRIQKLAARSTELAVKRFEAEILKNQSRVYYFSQRAIEAENKLNFLIGRYPQHIERSPLDLDKKSVVALHLGLPIHLLENRPDVKKAELDLEAAKLNVDVAKTLFYPSLNIDAGVGFQSFDITKLFRTPESMVYNIAGNLFAPLLNRNSIKANYFTKNAQQMQAVWQYERTVLNAYIEAVNQLNMVKNVEQSYEAKTQQVERLSTATEVSLVLFRSARADYLDVLTTRRDALDAQMERVETKKDQMNAWVDLYKSLGGGWR